VQKHFFVILILAAFLCACSGQETPAEDSGPADQSSTTVDTLTAETELNDSSMPDTQRAPDTFDPNKCVGDELAIKPISSDMQEMRDRFDTNKDLLRLVFLLSPT
jgi:PBP1b-binding outer membrane lipoprotein LpoB